MKTRIVVGKAGAEPALWPWIWVPSREGERERKRAKENRWDEQKRKKKNKHSRFFGEQPAVKLLFQVTLAMDAIREFPNNPPTPLLFYAIFGFDSTFF